MLTHPHELATYGSDGLLHYHQVPRGGGAARRPPSRCSRSCGPATRRGPVGGAGVGHRAVGRRAAGRRGRADRARAAAADPLGRRSTTRWSWSSRGSPTSRVSKAVAPTPLLPARPLEPDRVLDRRQRGRELGRRALLQVRLHDQLRRRARGRAPRRQRCVELRPRRPRLRPARGVRRLRGHARRRDQDLRCGWSPRRRASRTLLAFFEDTDARRRRGLGDRRRGHRARARSR